MSCIIKNGFTNYRGEVYDNIKNYSYQENEPIYNFGKLVDGTEYKDNIFLSTSYNLNNGVDIYKSEFDENVALRIFRDTMGCCKNYKYVFHDDDKLVSKLQGIQKNVKLTDFPIGIVSIDKWVIGQIIPYYNGYDTLAKSVIKADENTIIQYYSNILTILKELYSNGIIYVDVRARNFMINKINSLVKLIDFESGYLSFDNSKSRYIDMMENLRVMINEINKLKDINFQLPTNITLNDVEKIIKEEQIKRLKL